MDAIASKLESLSTAQLLGNDSDTDRGAPTQEVEPSVDVPAAEAGSLAVTDSGAATLPLEPTTSTASVSPDDTDQGLSFLLSMEATTSPAPVTAPPAAAAGADDGLDFLLNLSSDPEPPAGTANSDLDELLGL